MRAGLVSVSFRSQSPETIIDWAQRAELQAIEWGGDIHVPHGDLKTARRVGQATREAGLQIAAYGSYYKVGVSEGEGLSFDAVLATAVELGAPAIRVWAGAVGSAVVDDGAVSRIVAETGQICDMAAATGLDIAFEFHGHTLTDSGVAAQRLLEATNHSHLKCLWQPRVGATVDERLHDLHLIAPWLLNFHVFHWQEDATGKWERLSLTQGEGEWRTYFEAADEIAMPCYALLEFLPAETYEQLIEDSATLRRWCEMSA